MIAEGCYCICANEIYTIVGGILGASIRQFKGGVDIGFKKLKPILVLSNVVVGTVSGYILGLDFTTAIGMGLLGSYVADNGIQSLMKLKNILKK